MEAASSPMAVILMGVSGSGKTAVGRLLSHRLGWLFFDGDAYHPPDNIAKMGRGTPLNDQDRAPWLGTLNQLIHRHIKKGRSIILACSALKQDYRRQLSHNNPGTIFIFLKGDYDLIFSRMQDRSSHYMKANMLHSQFEDLEEPNDALVIDIDQDLGSITTEIIERLHLKDDQA